MGAEITSLGANITAFGAYITALGADIFKFIQTYLFKGIKCLNFILH